MKEPHPHPAFCSSWEKAQSWGMLRQEYDRMVAWCEKYGDNPQTLRWLYRNPPPDTWRGTPAEYAYTEMPLGLFR